MAIWEFQVSLVPKAGIERIHGSVPSSLPDYQAADPEALPDEATDFPNYWESLDPRPTLDSTISAVLASLESWTPEAQMYGVDNGNRVEVWSDDVNFRMDLRNPDLRLARL